MPRYKLTRTISIGTGETTSAQLMEGTLSGIVIPGSVITASYVSFLVSTDGQNYIPLLDKDSAEVILITTASPRAYQTNYDAFLPWTYIKAREGISGSEVYQKIYDADIEFIFDTK